MTSFMPKLVLGQEVNAVYNVFPVGMPSIQIMADRDLCSLPGTATGTVRCRAVTVALAIFSAVYVLVQLCPAVTMLGLSKVPSR